MCEIKEIHRPEGKKCLNCGSMCTGMYCPDCGQPTSTPRRLTMKSLGKSAALSFARLTPGFWPTFIGLIVHPWEVIRDYICGRRMKYSPPVTMVIQLLLYITVFYAVVGQLLHINFFDPHENDIFDFMGYNSLLKMMLSSDVFVKIFMWCVVAVNCYLVYRHQGKRKYNLAEYITAMIYMGCCFSIYNSIAGIPFVIFDIPGSSLFKILVDLIIGTIALFKVFPISVWWKRWGIWTIFMLLNLLAFVFFIALLVIPYILFQK